ncbi:MAG TPA: prephenate dehydratase [Limnochordales bacterium]
MPLDERPAPGPGTGYLGPEGSFSHEAARRWRRLHPEAGPLVPFGDLGALFAAAERGRVAFAVCPLENSLEGSVVLTLDLWLHESTLRQVGEVVLPVHQWLMVRPGVTLTQVERVLSHPHALMQCRRTLQALLPGVPTEGVSSTAEAARRVAASPRPWAAVAGAEAAALHGLELAFGPAQDGQPNATRFGVLARGWPAPTGRDRTTLVVGSLRDRPGLLRDLLAEFADRGINLTRIESRPSREGLGRYLFLIDLEGHAEDPAVAEAIAAVRRQVGYLRLLGSYPRDPGEG